MSSRLDNSSPDTASESSIASILVARFLRSNNFHETLDIFIREAALPADVGTVTPIIKSSENELNESGNAEQWTLENIIQEKKKFDQTSSFERYGDSLPKKDAWSTPAPALPEVIQTPASSNLLSVSVEPWQVADDDQDEDKQFSYIVATGADKRLNAFKLDPGNAVAASVSGISDSPILSYVSLREGRYQLLASMSGQLLLVRNARVLDQRRDHKKYVVKVIAYEDHDQDEVWVVTAGWDAQVLIYRMAIPSSSSDTVPTINEPVGSINLSTNPESILIVRHPETQNLTLLLSRRDSTFIYYYDLGPLRSSSMLHKLEETGKQNLAPHSNAWIAFSPSCLVQSPHDPSLIAVALSTMPHMKVMIVRLLFPSSRSNDDNTTVNRNVGASRIINEVSPTGDFTSATETQATQAMAALALQNREDAAIIIQANTFAPQTAYSTPQVVWRPDGSGVWVNGDDGVIRGIETKTGKLVTTLKNGHEAGSKVRSIWAGRVTTNGSSEEWVISGGFDKRLIVWKPEETPSQS